MCRQVQLGFSDPKPHAKRKQGSNQKEQTELEPQNLVEALNEVLIEWQKRPYPLQKSPKHFTWTLLENGERKCERAPPRPDDCLTKYFAADKEMYKRWHNIIFEHHPEGTSRAYCLLPSLSRALPTYRTSSSLVHRSCESHRRPLASYIDKFN